MAIRLEEYHEDEYSNSLGETFPEMVYDYLIYLAERTAKLYQEGDIRSAKIVAEKGRSLSMAYDNEEDFFTLI